MPATVPGALHVLHRLQQSYKMGLIKPTSEMTLRITGLGCDRVETRPGGNSLSPHSLHFLAWGRPSITYCSVPHSVSQAIKEGLCTKIVKAGLNTEGNKGIKWIWGLSQLYEPEVLLPEAQGSLRGDSVFLSGPSTFPVTAPPPPHPLPSPSVCLPVQVWNPTSLPAFQQLFLWRLCSAPSGTD